MSGLGPLGRMLMLMGLILVAAGGLMLLADRLPGLGRLPGDLVWRRGNVSLYVPLATSLVLSLLLTLILNLIFRR